MNKFENAFIFHGTAGSPEGNWFPWLKSELEKHGVPTVVPRFPTPEGESLQAWFDVLDAVQEKITNESLLMGHSKGGMFLLKILERLTDPVDYAVFVSAPIGVQPILYYDADKKFTNFEFDWDKIKANVKQAIVFHSDDDPYVSLANGEGLAQKLDTEIHFIPNAGHINAESGYTKFPQLLEVLGLER